MWGCGNVGMWECGGVGMWGCFFYGGLGFVWEICNFSRGGAESQRQAFYLIPDT
jgi:hypothetical protein